MSDSDGRKNAPRGGLILAVFIVVTASFFGAANQWRLDVTRVSQGAEQPSAERHTADTSQYYRRAGVSDEDVVFARASFLLAFWQTVMNGFGLAALGLTVFYAHKAWEEAKRSGQIAEAALEGAIADAAEQADRFSRQLAISEQNLDISRQSIAELDRAWLSVTLTPVGGLTIGEAEVSIRASFVIENVGRGPAVGVQYTQELTFGLSELDRRVRHFRADQIFARRFGEVLFPGGRIADEARFSVSREKMEAAISADRALPTPIGVYPTIVMGAHYYLPGSDEQRVTYIYLNVYKASPEIFWFSDVETQIALSDLRWRTGIMTGPVT